MTPRILLVETNPPVGSILANILVSQDLVVDSIANGSAQKDMAEGFIHDEICFDIPNHKKNSSKPAHDQARKFSPGTGMRAMCRSRAGEIVSSAML